MQIYLSLIKIFLISWILILRFYILHDNQCKFSLNQGKDFQLLSGKTSVFYIFVLLTIIFKIKWEITFTDYRVKLQILFILKIKWEITFTDHLVKLQILFVVKIKWEITFTDYLVKLQILYVFKIKWEITFTDYLENFRFYLYLKLSEQ